VLRSLAAAEFAPEAVAFTAIPATDNRGGVVAYWSGG
jgi:hypothetical protein